MQQLKDFVIQWNNENPLDRWWRQRYKVPFGSSAHLEISQAHIAFEYLEQQIYTAQAEQMQEEEKRKERLKENGWLNANDEVDDDDFDKIVI